MTEPMTKTDLIALDVIFDSWDGSVHPRVYFGQGYRLYKEVVRTHEELQKEKDYRVKRTLAYAKVYKQLNENEREARRLLAVLRHVVSEGRKMYSSVLVQRLTTIAEAGLQDAT